MATGKRIKTVDDVADPATATAEDVATVVNELLDALRESGLLDR